LYIFVGLVCSCATLGKMTQLQLANRILTRVATN